MSFPTEKTHGTSMAVSGQTTLEEFLGIRVLTPLEETSVSGGHHERKNFDHDNDEGAQHHHDHDDRGDHLHDHSKNSR